MRKLLIVISGLIVIGIATYLYFVLTMPVVTSAEMDKISGVPPVIDCGLPGDFPGLSKEIYHITEGKSGIFRKMNSPKVGTEATILSMTGTVNT